MIEETLVELVVLDRLVQPDSLARRELRVNRVIMDSLETLGQLVSQVPRVKQVRKVKLVL